MLFIEPRWKSYVVKTSTSIAAWRNDLISSVHPAGFALFSQINPTNTLDLKIKTLKKVLDPSNIAS